MSPTVAQQAARGGDRGKFGAESVPAKPPVYTRKAKGAQEAHEAIRPTDARRDPESVRSFSRRSSTASTS